jgi:hypothetical protein
MATDWNAVILLDEADVFMAERSPADIARNELVSIFLRELEYFRASFSSRPICIARSTQHSDRE